MIATAWMILGVPMAFHKAVFSSNLVWIGVSLQVTSKEVTVEVPESKVKELQGLIDEALAGNVIPAKKLHTLVGKCMSIASVIYVWRPFLQILYAALRGPNKVPENCIWTRQVRHSLTWIKAFLAEEAGSIRRIYNVERYFCTSHRIQITWDASPYGMGAFLTIDGTMTEYFAIPISSDDEEILGAKSGGCEAQQLWECLSGLVAMRLWAKHWMTSRVRLHLRGDNVSSLVLFSTLKSHSKQLSTIAREFALDLGAASFKPEVVEHLPGIANTVADQLSRKFDPNKQFSLHPCLQHAKEVMPPPRTRSWWKTLEVPLNMPAEPTGMDGACRGNKRKQCT